MAKQKAAKPRTPKPKQQYLPGTAPVEIKEVSEAADTYRELRNDRQAALELEVEAQQKLLELMHKHNLTQYEYDGYVVKRNPVEKVSVRKKPGTNGESEE